MWIASFTPLSNHLYSTDKIFVFSNVMLWSGLSEYISRDLWGGGTWVSYALQILPSVNIQFPQRKQLHNLHSLSCILTSTCFITYFSDLKNQSGKILKLVPRSQLAQTCENDILVFIHQYTLAGTLCWLFVNLIPIQKHKILCILDTGGFDRSIPLCQHVTHSFLDMTLFAEWKHKEW